MSKLYDRLRGLIVRVSPPMTTEWAEPFDGRPAVFCPNHAGAFGPIDICAHFPLSDHCHPWFNAGIADRRTVPAYVRQDYWWRPGCFAEPLLNMTLPYLAARPVRRPFWAAYRACGLPRYARHSDLPPERGMAAQGRASDHLRGAALGLAIA